MEDLSVREYMFVCVSGNSLTFDLNGLGSNFSLICVFCLTVCHLLYVCVCMCLCIVWAYIYCVGELWYPLVVHCMCVYVCMCTYTCMFVCANVCLSLCVCSVVYIQ